MAAPSPNVAILSDEAVSSHVSNLTPLQRDEGRTAIGAMHSTAASLLPFLRKFNETGLLDVVPAERPKVVGLIMTIFVSFPASASFPDSSC